VLSTEGLVAGEYLIDVFFPDQNTSQGKAVHAVLTNLSLDQVGLVWVTAARIVEV
jgi:hypothetical protein